MNWLQFLYQALVYSTVKRVTIVHIREHASAHKRFQLIKCKKWLYFSYLLNKVEARLHNFLNLFFKRQWFIKYDSKILGFLHKSNATPIYKCSIDLRFRWVKAEKKLIHPVFNSLKTLVDVFYCLNM